MRVNVNTNFLRLKNNIPVIKNHVPPKSAPEVNLDNVFIDSLYGGNQEITKEDALLYKYWQENPISIFDSSQNQKAISVNSVADIPKEFIEQLNHKEITSWDKNRLNFALDFKKYGNDIDSSLNSLAAAYVTTLEHLNTHFTGEKLEGYINELESRVSEIEQEIAGYFSENVGGFLEKNGFEGESENIYNSIVSEYEKKVEQYSDFIKEDSDYAHLKGTEDEWLLNDVAYMSQQLQKAYPTKKGEKGNSESVYSLEEIGLANSLIKETNHTSFFKSLGNEESVGLEVGMLLLKTNLFAENNGVSDEFADKMTAAVKAYVDKKINSENARIEAMYDAPYYDKEKSPVYDKSAIYEVSEKILLLYQTEKDYTKAILDGIEYARKKSDSKEDRTGIVDRYKDNKYWERFYDNSSLFSSKYFFEIKGYDKTSEFQNLVNSWNDFAFGITKSNEYQMRAENFSKLT